jgi:hypothetical protein
MVDYDRYRTNLSKLQTKNEKTINDEKQIFKVCVLTPHLEYHITLF